MNQATATPKKRSLRFPFIVLALTGIILVVLWLIPKGNDTSNFNMFKMLVFLVGGSIFLFSLFFRPGWPRKVLLPIILLVLTTGLVFFKPVSMDGDFFPIFAPRDWVLSLMGESPDDIVERDRRAQGQVEATVEIKEKVCEWPGYRGPNRDGIAQGKNLNQNWNKNPPKELWRNSLVGGYASFAAAEGFLFTIEQRRDEETVVCYQASSGKEVWAKGWKARFTEQLGGPGPRATPTLAGNLLYALGAKGRLACLDVTKKGEELWAVEILDNNSNITWGMSGSPLVVDDLVIVCPGVQGGAANRGVLAYDRLTGKERWAAGSAQGGYSSPHLAVLLNERQVLVFDGLGISGYSLDGKERWRFDWANGQKINVAQPIVLDDQHLIVGCEYGLGSALIKLDKEGEQWKVTQVAKNKEALRLKHSSAVLRKIDGKDYIFGLSSGKLQCVNARDLSIVWSDDRTSKEGKAYGHGQMLCIDDKLYITTEYNELVLVEATPKAFNELGRVKALNRGPKNWNTPAIVDGKIYIRNEQEMACYDLTNGK